MSKRTLFIFGLAIFTLPLISLNANERPMAPEKSDNLIARGGGHGGGGGGGRGGDWGGHGGGDWGGHSGNWGGHGGDWGGHGGDWNHGNWGDHGNWGHNNWDHGYDNWNRGNWNGTGWYGGGVYIGPNVGVDVGVVNKIFCPSFADIFVCIRSCVSRLLDFGKSSYNHDPAESLRCKTASSSPLNSILYAARSS